MQNFLRQDFLNLHRRHLAPSQRSMVGARAKEHYERLAAKRLEEGRKKGGETGGRGRPKVNQDSSPVTLPESKGDARDAAGKAVGVSGRMIDFRNSWQILEYFPG